MKTSDWYVEKKYWISRWISLKARTMLSRLMPDWLLKAAMIKASRHIRPNEVVPEVPFMTVFSRIGEKKTK